MKYIDKFATLDDFFTSELGQMTGDRIATIEGFELPVLKKKMKTVVTVDPSTNEEVETEELQDVWMVPVGQEEKKVDHDYSLFYAYDESSIAGKSTGSGIVISDIKNFYNAGILSTSNDGMLAKLLKGIGADYGLYDHNLKQWGFTVTDSDTFTTNVTQNGYDIKDSAISRSYKTSWEDGGYWYLSTRYTNSSYYSVVPNKIKDEILANAQNNIASFELHDTGITLQNGNTTIPVTVDIERNFYLADNSFPQDFDSTHSVLELELRREDFIDWNNITYDPVNREIVLYVSNVTNRSRIAFADRNNKYHLDIKSFNGYKPYWPETLTYTYALDSESDDYSFSNGDLILTNNALSDTIVSFSLTCTSNQDGIAFLSKTVEGVENIIAFDDLSKLDLTLTIVFGEPQIDWIVPEGTTTINGMTLSSLYYQGTEESGKSPRPTVVNIPSSVERIEDSAFWGWTITKLFIESGSSLEYIGSQAFCLKQGQDTITSVKLPANCMYLDESFGGINQCSFSNADSNGSIVAPITVNGGQVYSCRLSDILSSEQKATLKSGGLNSNVWSSLDNSWWSTIANKVTIADFDNIWSPSDTVSISDGEYLFSSFSRLKVVNFPTQMTGTLSNTFSSCQALTTVTGIDNITSIGSNCFKNTNITSFTLPASVTTIGSSAFAWETNMLGPVKPAPLTSFTIPQGSSLIMIDGGAFSGQSNLLSITLPVDCEYAATAFHENTVITGGTPAWNMHDENHYGQVVKDGAVAVADRRFKNSSEFLNNVDYYLPSTVTSIGDQSFYGCNNLKSITLHSGITSIGAEAFGNNYSLSSIELPSTLASIGNGAFKSCSSLSIELPVSWSVTSIPQECFSQCSFLNSSTISIPSGTTTIGDKAFYNCGGLESVTIPNSVTSIGSGAFIGTKVSAVTLPTGCVWYETSFPADCVVTASTTALPVVADLSLKSASGVLDSNSFSTWFGSDIFSKVIIPEGVTELQTSYGCWFPWSTSNVIKEVQLPSTLTTVGNSTFCNMKSLTTIDTQYLENISNSLFEGDESLFYSTAPTINANVTTIGDKAFKSTMKDVSTLDLSSSSLTYIGASAFADTGLTSVTLPVNCVYNMNSFPADCSVTDGSLFVYDETDVYNSCGVNIFPTGTTSISVDPLSMYFDEKPKLTSLNIPAEITSIGSYCFNYYSNLNTLTFLHTASDTISIGDDAFGYNDIRSLTIPQGCTYIGSRAFKGNTNLSSLTFANTSGEHSLISIGQEAFANTALTSVTFPADSSATYWPNSFPENCVVTGGSLPDTTLHITSANMNNSYSYQNYYTKVVFESDVTGVAYEMFRGCQNIEEIEFNNSDSLTIQSNAFRDCTKLSKVTCNGNLIFAIYDAIFVGTALTSVELPYNSMYEANAFPSGCTVTIEPYYSHVITSNLATDAYRHDDSGHSNNDYNVSVTSVKIAEGVTSIGESAFNGCSNLTYVKLPSTLETIGIGAFIGTAISSIDIPEGCLGYGNGELAYGTFMNCSSLTSVYIPDSITKIGNSCFHGCSSLQSIELPYGCQLVSGAFGNSPAGNHITFRSAPSA